MSSISQADPKVKDTATRFAEILRRLQAGEISQAEAERQADALNPNARYLRDTALLLQPKRASRMYK